MRGARICDNGAEARGHGEREKPGYGDWVPRRGLTIRPAKTRRNRIAARGVEGDEDREFGCDGLLM